MPLDVPTIHICTHVDLLCMHTLTYSHVGAYFGASLIDSVFSVSPVVPLAPELHLEPLNCTTILARWQLENRNSVSVLGYKLFYHEETQPESAPLQLRASDNRRSISGLGESCFSHNERHLYAGTCLKKYWTPLLHIILFLHEQHLTQAFILTRTSHPAQPLCFVVLRCVFTRVRWHMI